MDQGLAEHVQKSVDFTKDKWCDFFGRILLKGGYIWRIIFTNERT